MSAVDITVCTPAGNWHFDGRLEQMSDAERVAYEALLILAGPGDWTAEGKPRRLREAAH